MTPTPDIELPALPKPTAVGVWVYTEPTTHTDGAMCAFARAAVLADRARTAASCAWIDLTDEDRDRALRTLPDMLDGFLKKWGWLHFAKAVEAICKEKNAAPATVRAEHALAVEVQGLHATNADMLAALRRAVLALAFAAETSPAMMRDDYNAVSNAIARATAVPAPTAGDAGGADHAGD